MIKSNRKSFVEISNRGIIDEIESVAEHNFKEEKRFTRVQLRVHKIQMDPIP